MEQSKQPKKGHSGEQVAERLMKDDRFGKMFTDTSFQIDKHSEAYKLIRPQDSKAKRIKDEDVDSAGEESEDDGADVKKARDLNKLFAGKGDGDSSDDDANGSDDDDFQAKMTKQQRKKFKKQKGKDRILMGKPAAGPQGMRHLPKDNKQGGIAD